MTTTKVKQPIITQSEINKIENYQIKKRLAGKYHPWVTARQSQTHGQGHILTSHKADHPVHLLSLGEHNAFLTVEHESSVICIYEQFPLCIRETMKIAKELNIRHPGSYKERVKHDMKIPAKTMTTDLVVVMLDERGSTAIQPYSFKYSSSLDLSQTSGRSVNRTQNKLKIETAYWSDKSNGLRLINETFFCATKIYNLSYLRQCFDYCKYIEQKSAIYISTVITFKKLLTHSAEKTLKECIETAAITVGIDAFHAECVFQHACYEGLLPVDLSQKIELWAPVPLYAKVNPYAY